MAKTNKKGFCKDTIYKLTNNCTGCYYLVFSSKLVVPGGRPLISIVYKYKSCNLSILLLQRTHGAKSQVFTIYLSTLNSFIMLIFALLLVPLSCLSYLDLLMRLAPTKNQGSLIYRCKISGLISSVGYGYAL